MGALEGGHLRRREPVGRRRRVREDSRGDQGRLPDLPEGCGPDLPGLEGEARLHRRVLRSGRQLRLAEEVSELSAELFLIRLALTCQFSRRALCHKIEYVSAFFSK